MAGFNCNGNSNLCNYIKGGGRKKENLVEHIKELHKRSGAYVW